MNNQEFDKVVRDMTPREIISFVVKTAAATILGGLIAYVIVGFAVIGGVWGFLWVLSLFA